MNANQAVLGRTVLSVRACFLGCTVAFCVMVGYLHAVSHIFCSRCGRGLSNWTSLGGQGPSRLLSKRAQRGGVLQQRLVRLRYGLMCLFQWVYWRCLSEKYVSGDVSPCCDCVALATCCAYLLTIAAAPVLLSLQARVPVLALLTELA